VQQSWPLYIGTVAWGLYIGIHAALRSQAASYGDKPGIIWANSSQFGTLAVLHCNILVLPIDMIEGATLP